jgi:MFS family permease
MGFVVNYIDRGNTAVAGPRIAREFDVSPARMGLLYPSFFLAYAVMQVPAGLLVDRFNLKWLYAAAFVIWSLSNAALPPNSPWLKLRTCANVLALKT